MTRVVFLDGGARAGEALDWYVNKRADLAGCEVHFFEPNPAHQGKLQALCRVSPGRMRLVPAALWTEAGTAELFLCLEDEGDWGSSIVKESRRHLDRDHPINVQLIDLAGYILENFGPEDHIVLKLDVEGAEYHLVPHLIRTGAIELVDEIHVEWHDEWFADTSVELEAPKALLEEAALKYGLRVEEWEY